MSMKSDVLELRRLRPVAGHLRGIGRVEVGLLQDAHGPAGNRGNRCRSGLDCHPHPHRGDGEVIGATTDVDRVDHPVRARIDARHGPVEAVRDPDGAGADRYSGGARADVDGGRDCARRGIEPCDLAVGGVGDPDPTGAHGDGARSVTHRRHAGHDPGAIDA
jgi:hypothetical protein